VSAVIAYALLSERKPILTEYRKLEEAGPIVFNLPFGPRSD
jgi:hypothetical protein